MSFASFSGAGAPPEDRDHQGNHGRQPKANSQREYRKREGDVFNELRDIITGLDGQEPTTRHDILSGASRLLRQLEAQNASLRRQLTIVSPTRGSGGNSFGPPEPSSLHNASYGLPRTNNTQPPDASSQRNLLMPSGSMSVEQLARLIDQDFQDILRSNDTHPYPPAYYRN